MIGLELLKELLFPRKCVLCGAVLSADETHLCHRCRLDAPVWHPQDKRIRHISGNTAIWFYEDTVRESLHRFKFQNRSGYAEAYGLLMAMDVRRTFLGIDLITWVPISPQRLKERGYDQSELLAKTIGRELGIPVVPILRKIRDNPAQSGISDSALRRENVRDAYVLRETAQVTDKRILLVDDILTTGATVSECGGILKKAGASSVCLSVVASVRRKE